MYNQISYNTFDSGTPIWVHFLDFHGMKIRRREKFQYRPTFQQKAHLVRVVKFLVFWLHFRCPDIISLEIIGVISGSFFGFNTHNKMGIMSAPKNYIMSMGSMTVCTLAFPK